MTGLAKISNHNLITNEELIDLNNEIQSIKNDKNLILENEDNLTITKDKESSESYEDIKESTKNELKEIHENKEKKETNISGTDDEIKSDKYKKRKFEEGPILINLKKLSSESKQKKLLIKIT